MCFYPGYRKKRRRNKRLKRRRSEEERKKERGVKKGWPQNGMDLLEKEERRIRR